jgi:hypothetical protein
MTNTPRQGQPEKASPVDQGHLIEVGLVEYNSLRQEILQRRATQRSLLGLALVTITALFGLAIGKKEDASPNLVLIVPPLGLAFCLLQLAESLFIDRIGSYIRDRIWLEIATAAGYNYSWEHYHGPNSRWKGVIAVLSDGAFPLVLSLSGVVALTLPNVHSKYEGLGWLCVGLTLVTPATFGIGYLIREHSRPKPEAINEAPGSFPRFDD